MNTRSRMFATSAFAVAVCMAMAANAQAALVINEFWADDAYTDSAEYIELYNNGGSAVTLDGLSLIVVDGDTSGSTSSPNYKLVTMQINLSGSLAADGYLLIGAGLTPNVDIPFTLGDLQNGSQTYAIVRTIDIDYETGSQLTDASVAAITANLTDAIASQDQTAGDHVYFGAPAIPYNPNSNDSGSKTWDTASRIPNGTDTNTVNDWQTQDNYGSTTPPPYAKELGDANDALSSPGAQNGGTKLGACCNGASCSYVSQATCTGGGGTYIQNWRDCSNPYNPCVGPACKTINEAKALDLGTPVTLCNVVVSYEIDTVNSADVATMHVQDLSGSPTHPRGIVLFGSTSIIDAIKTAVAVGDQVDIRGTLDVSTWTPSGGDPIVTGTLQLVDDELMSPLELVTNYGAVGTPDLVAATCSDFVEGNPRAEELESVRVKLACVAFLNPTGNFAGGQNYVICDGTNYATVRTAGDNTYQPIVGTAIPSGAVAVTAVVSQYDLYSPYDGGYQLLVVEAADVNGAPTCNTGACCFPDASCRVLSQAICTQLLGTYRGNGTTCPPTPPCEVVTTGACCWSDDSCSDGVSKTACVALEGSYRGDGSTCAGLGCTGFSTIAEAKALGTGNVVTLREVVMNCMVDMVNAASRISYFGQDLSGPGGTPRGICFTGATAAMNTEFAGVQEGDRIMVYGKTNSFNGLFQVDGTLSPTLDVMQEYPTPGTIVTTEVTVADLQPQSQVAEDLEGSLVRLECVSFQVTGTFSTGVNYWVTDGSEQVAIVYVSTSTNEWIGQPIPTGPVTITGVLSQYDTTSPYDSYYEILPRRWADMGECSSVCQTCGGDLNGDNVVDEDDLDNVTEFVDALLGTDETPNYCADVNEDGDIDGEDIAEFVTRVIDGYDCVQDPEGTIRVSQCDSPVDVCATDNVNMFCKYTVIDNAETQAMLVGLPQCVGLNGLEDGDSICTLCSVPPPAECPAVNGSITGWDEVQIFRWVDGNGTGQDCYFVAGRVTFDCFNCIGASSYRFTIVTP